MAGWGGTDSGYSLVPCVGRNWGAGFLGIWFRIESMRRGRDGVKKAFPGEYNLFSAGHEWYNTYGQIPNGSMAECTLCFGDYFLQDEEAFVHKCAGLINSYYFEMDGAI